MPMFASFPDDRSQWALGILPTQRDWHSKRPRGFKYPKFKDSLSKNQPLMGFGDQNP